MILISHLLDRRLPRAIWARLIPVLILANPAVGQLGNDFSPRAFNGKPLVASVRGVPASSDGLSVFRNYRFNSEGRLLRIEQGSSTLGVTLEVTFEADPEGRPVKASAMFMGNLGWTETYSYDEKGRLETWKKLNPRTGVETVSRRHVYDEEGRQLKTILVRAGRPPEETARTFDASNRVLQEESTSEGKLVRRTEFEYDASGCLAKQVSVLSKGQVEVREWTHGADCQANQLRIRSFGGKTNVVEMTYDGKGNLVAESTLREGRSTPEVQQWTYEFAEAVSEKAEASE
ncbi:MAG: hypothetical protein OSA40_03710 [Phycisphaerales bacterium]|nr:hypothetical protein [Phycisphaerales bacterium]